MIVEMKNVTVLCLDSDREATLEALYGMGVVHVVNAQEPTGREVERTREELEQAAAALEAVRAAAARTRERAEDAPPTPTAATATTESLRPPDDGREGAARLAPTMATEEAVRLAGERAEAEKVLADLRAEVARVEPWGDFDPSLIGDLEERGLFVTLLRAPADVSLIGPAGTLLEEISADEQRRYSVLITSGPFDPAYLTPSGAASEMTLPAEGLGEMRAMVEHRQKDLERIDDGLAALEPSLSALEQARSELEQAVHMAEVRAGMGTSDKLCYLQGYVPAPEIPRLQEAAVERGWGIATREPEPTERVPTLLRLSRGVKPIGVLFNVLRISPAYWETDVSVAFLIFFTLFVGLLIGDAGYGFLVLALAIYLTVRARGVLSDAVKLLYVLSLSVILFGALQGSWLGIAELPAPLAALQVDWFSDQANVMQLCFLIGAVHMTLAHLWTGAVQFPQLAFLAQVGWVAIVWSMFFAASALVLGRPFPSAVVYVLAAGVILVVLFLMPPSRMRQHLMEYVLLPLTLVGFFVDVISYIRLFAVGVATLAVSQSFNGMAASIGYDGVLTAIFAVIILIFGHSLNLALCLLAVLVHGVRLNTLEFSAHKGLSWSGFAFRPFARGSRGYASSAG